MKVKVTPQGESQKCSESLATLLTDNAAMLAAAAAAVAKSVIYVFSLIFLCDYVNFRPLLQRIILDLMLSHSKNPTSHWSPEIVGDEGGVGIT